MQDAEMKDELIKRGIETADIDELFQLKEKIRECRKRIDEIIIKNQERMRDALRHN